LVKSSECRALLKSHVSRRSRNVLRPLEAKAPTTLGQKKNSALSIMKDIREAFNQNFILNFDENFDSNPLLRLKKIGKPNL